MLSRSGVDDISSSSVIVDDVATSSMKEVVTFSCGEVVGTPSSDVVGESSVVVAAVKVVGAASTPAFFNGVDTN